MRAVYFDDDGALNMLVGRVNPLRRATSRFGKSPGATKNMKRIFHRVYATASTRKLLLSSDRPSKDPIACALCISMTTEL